MKNTTQKELTDAEVRERFSNTAAEFRAEIEQIATDSGKTVTQVYRLWREYSKRCEWSDQSALLWEFKQWYAKDLGLTKEQVAR